MRNLKEIIFTVIGCIADIIAIIIAIKSLTIAIPFLIIALILLVFSVIYLYNKYKERCDFVNFIQYLFDNNTHNFNVLPKICLALDKSREVNDLSIKVLSVVYTFDMRNLNPSTPNDTIIYSNTIEYHIEAENKNIPKEYVFFRGNMNADDIIELQQKHGSQETYVTIPPPRYTDETRPNTIIQRYSWYLNRENITNSRSFPMSFKFIYKERSTANSDFTIILYPMQFAKDIEQLNFKIKILSDKNDVLKKITLHKIWKDDKSFKHTPITDLQNHKNEENIQIQPDTSKFEAYYFRAYIELI